MEMRWDECERERDKEKNKKITRNEMIAQGNKTSERIR